MHSKKVHRRARVITYAAEYRSKFYSDDDIFEPMEHIELVLSEKSSLTIACRSEIFEGWIPAFARVRFFQSGRMCLEYAEQTGREAICGLPSARFALCHEIGHVNLHRRQMNNKIDGAARNLVNQSDPRLHPETAGMEEEAHIYGGLLMIPLSQITVEADPMDLAKRYNAPPNVAKQLRLDVLEVWSTVKKLQKERKNR